jgi:spermidine dehydrogenase
MTLETVCNASPSLGRAPSSTGQIDYLPGLSSVEKKARLSRISYGDYLLDLVKVDPSVIPLYQSRTYGEWGVGIDAVSALDVWPFGFPGFQGLKLGAGSAPPYGLHGGRLRNGVAA